MAESPTMAAAIGAAEPVTRVKGTINYLGDMASRPKFHAQEHGRDNLRYDPHIVTIENARTWQQPPSLEREGMALISHPTAVSDFRDPDEVRRIYLPEIEELVRYVTKASRVVVLPGGGLVRYTERSPHFRTGVNTQPARFPHVDFTLAAPMPGRRNHGCDLCPLVVSHIAWVSQMIAIVPRSIFLRPHRQPLLPGCPPMNHNRFI